MPITMVKKVLADGSPCRKCVQAEEMLRRRKLWHRIDNIIVADERDPESVGFLKAQQYEVETAPFFIVKEDGNETLYTSPLELIRQVLKPKKGKVGTDIDKLRVELD